MSWPPRVAEAALAEPAAAMTNALIPPLRPFCLALPGLEFLFEDWKKIEWRVTRGVMIPALDPDPESDFQLFGVSGS